MFTPTTTTIILISLAIFILGSASGWLITKMSEGTFTRSNLQILVGVLVTIVWVLAIIAEIIIPAYTVSVLIHGIMGAIVGYLFSDDGLSINLTGKNNDD